MKEPQGTQSDNNQGDWQLICPYNKLWLTINPNVFSIIFDLLNVRKDDIVGTRRQLVSSNSYIFIDSLALLHTCLGIKAKCVHNTCTIRYQSSNNFIYRITKKTDFCFSLSIYSETWKLQECLAPLTSTNEYFSLNLWFTFLRPWYGHLIEARTFSHQRWTTWRSLFDKMSIKSV